MELYDKNFRFMEVNPGCENADLFVYPRFLQHVNYCFLKNRRSNMRGMKEPFLHDDLIPYCDGVCFHSITR